MDGRIACRASARINGREVPSPARPISSNAAIVLGHHCQDSIRRRDTKGENVELDLRQIREELQDRCRRFVLLAAHLLKCIVLPISPNRGRVQ
jgi:hypothetical protein